MGMCVRCFPWNGLVFLCGGSIFVFGVLGYVCFQGCGGLGVCGWWVFRRVSEIALGNIVWLSFKWLLAVNSAWMWNCSIVFRWAPFLWYCNTCIMLFMVPKECAFLLRCFAKLDVWLLLRKACLCPLYHIVKFLLVCSTYAFLQSGQVSLYTPIVKIYQEAGCFTRVDFL